MSEWTPGPWAVEADMRSMQDRWGDGDGDGEYLAGWNITSQSGEVVGIEGITPDDGAEANAHLIAAAPDLYEALDNLLIGIGMGWDLDGMIDVATAALAKARGETK